MVEFFLASENVDRFVPHYDSLEPAIAGQISEHASQHIEAGGKFEIWSRENWENEIQQQEEDAKREDVKQEIARLGL